MIDFEKLKIAMGKLEDATVIQLLEKLMAEGGEGANMALEACQDGMNIVGGLFESGEYYVADLIYAGELMTQAMNVIRPAIASGDSKGKGKVILCTVQGDLHDIGKNIVKAMLEAIGVEVLDLGIDVAPETILQTAQEQGVTVIGLSGVLSLSIDSMKATVDAFRAADLRDGVKIIIGGAPINDDYCKIVGADAWSVNAAKGAEICRNWLIG